MEAEARKNDVGKNIGSQQGVCSFWNSTKKKWNNSPAREILCEIFSVKLPLNSESFDRLVKSKPLETSKVQLGFC